MVVIALGCVVACGPQVATPTPPSGVRPDDRALGSIPRPGLATDLGTAGPGVDGSGDFLSFASELSPESTMTAYASQLVGAGFHDAGRVGAWRVFTDPALTLWVRVGSGGPPTSLIVRVAPTPDDVADGVPPRPPVSTSLDAARPAPSTDVGDAGPGPSTRPATSAQRPDPPHASPRSGGVGSAGGGPAGGSTSGGTASGGGTAGGGTSGGTAPAANGGTGPESGTGTGPGGGNGTRP
jgi:hypothetical protein